MLILFICVDQGSVPCQQPNTHFNFVIEGGKQEWTAAMTL